MANLAGANHMPDWRKILFLAGSVVLLWVTALTGLLVAQDPPEGTVRAAGETANLFETVDSSRPVDGLRLTLPSEWEVRDVILLRYGTERVPRQLRSTPSRGTYLVTTTRPISGPHEVVVQVRLPDRTGTFDWVLRPLVRETAEDDSASEARYRTVGRQTNTVTVEDPRSPDGDNYVLALGATTTPLPLLPEMIPRLGGSASFTVEFWARTNGLNEILLSSWSGDESEAYPLEFVVDRGGRLRFYTGEPGRHRALRSIRPIADGRWHHVAAIYRAREPIVRLMVDGQVCDSLRGRLPSPTGRAAVALGGRVGDGAGVEEDPSLFSGHLDELRIWDLERPVRTVQRMRTYPLREVAGPNVARPAVRLGFESDKRRFADRWSGQAERVAASLNFESSLRNLQARTKDRSVTLRWESGRSDVEAFVVERSPDGRRFSTVARLEPTSSRLGSASDVPEYTYTDEDVPGQVVYYRIRQEQRGGGERVSGTIKMGIGAGREEEAPVELIGNFPNPFPKTTTVAFEVREAQPVSISVWDVAGHRIAQLADGTRKPGYHETTFNATDLPSGTYFVRLETQGSTQSHRMVVVK